MRCFLLTGLVVCLASCIASDRFVRAADAVAEPAVVEKAEAAEKEAEEKASAETLKAEEAAKEAGKKAAAAKEAAEKAEAEKVAAEKKAAELKEAEKQAAAKKAAEKAEAEKKAVAKKEAAKKDAEKKAAEEKAKKPHQLAVLNIKSGLSEGAGVEGMFGEVSVNLAEMIKRLEAAGKDEKIQGIILRLHSPRLERGKIDELRAAVQRVRKGGKKVYAMTNDITGGDYLLAIACDEIIMPPPGSVTISGVRAEVTFYKKLLDKLGIHADMLQVGDFKGAAEPVTRNEMSPEFRKQFESLIDDYYAQMVETIAADRKMEADRVKHLLDEGLFTAGEARTAGLIDRVVYEDEFLAGLKETAAVKEVKLVNNYGKKEIDTDFSGLAGMVKLMEMMSGRDSAKRTTKNKKIAVIYAVGAIASGESSSGMFGSTLGGDTLVKAIKQAEEDPKVVAIVLRVNSPGGSALASDLIWREVVRSKKPFIASMGDMAASGGYYISMGADKIYAEPGTLTGSIGVVGGKMALKGLFEKVGVNTEIISRGKNSGWESMDTPFTDSERAAWMKVMKEIYFQFTTKAAEGRKMDVAKLQELAQGKVYTGRQAVANNLVDQLGTLDDAIAEAKKKAGVGADETIERMVLPKPKSFFEQMLGGPDADAEVQVQVAKRLQAALPPGFGDLLGDATQLLQLFKEPAVTVLPYQIRIK